MPKVEKLKSVLKRVRWGSVAALAFMVFLVAAILLYSFGSGYEMGEDVGLKVSMNPSKVEPGSYASVEVELKNPNDSRNISVTVTAVTYESDIVFAESFTQVHETTPITIGPQGIRRISFRVKSKPETLEGRYSLDVSASADSSDPATSRVFLDVEDR